MFRSLEAFFRPKTVAIVGASDTGGGGWPRAIWENLEYAGFPTKVYLVNPRRDTLWGETVYPDFKSIPEEIDLALTIVPAEAIPDVLEEGTEAGLKTALIYAARFGEGGDDVGAQRAARVSSLCNDKGLLVCGPNCMGALSIADNMLFYPAPRVRGLPAGPVGVVFQSGGTFQYWLQQAATRGLGFSYAVSSGNELNIDLADYINFLVDDPATEVIACMIEGIRRPDAFMAAAEKALAAGKPIVAVKVGASSRGAAATQSHTGALAGDDAVFDAACRKYGVTRCHTLDDMLDTALAFRYARIPPGDGVAMAGFSGGGKGLFLDYAEQEGLELAPLADETLGKLAPMIDAGVSADNPLDTGAGIASQPAKFSEICRIVAEDANVDLLSMQGSLPMSDAEKIGDPATFANVAAAVPGKTVIAHGRTAQNMTEAGRAFQAETGVPFVQGLLQAVRVIKALTRYGAVTRQGVAALPPADGAAADLDGAPWDARLAEHNLPLPATREAATAEDAAKAAAGIGFPVALKIVSPQALHKTEVGGVALGLMDEISVQSEAEAMAARLRKAHPDATVDGYLVQEMVSGVEMLIGVRKDPQYGPVMVAGLGGVMVEAIKDVSLRLLPVTEADAREMLEELRGKTLLGEFRGRPARDIDALVAAMTGLSDLFLAHREQLSDLEVNPLIVLEEGAGTRAVDVRPIRS